MRIETKAKLDYLKGTKSAIADALVEKGQTVSSTDTFRSYADKVRAIKSGGGGLEPGVYFKRYEIPCYGSYYQYWMWFKGELYCFRLPYKGLGNDYEVFKYENGAWSKIVEKIGIYGLANPININGKLHLVGFMYHRVFDGETLTVLSNMPASNFSDSGYSAFLYKGKLRAFSYNVEYEWNESNDTWEVVSTHSILSPYSSPDVFTVNGEIYVHDAPKIYIYSNGTLTEVANTGSGYTYMGTYNDVAYFRGSTINVFDPATNSLRSVGYNPSYGRYKVNQILYSDEQKPNPYVIMGSNEGLACNEMIVVEDEG